MSDCYTKAAKYIDLHFLALCEEILSWERTGSAPDQDSHLRKVVDAAEFGRNVAHPLHFVADWVKNEALERALHYAKENQK